MDFVGHVLWINKGARKQRVVGGLFLWMLKFQSKEDEIMSEELTGVITEMNRRLVGEVRRGDRGLQIQVDRISKHKWFLKEDWMGPGDGTWAIFWP